MPSNPSMKVAQRLILELGRGGMGTVYLAVSEGPSGFSRLKVIKRLREDLAQDPSFLAMFMDEARLAARLRHPNIVQTNEVGFDGRYYFLEMEYLDGQALAALQRAVFRSGGVPHALAAWVIGQVLEGLHYAHELRDVDGTALNVVHRDVSPQNVFLTYDGQVKVLDFGIAKAANSSSDTRTGVVKGKATYMSPEQAIGRVVDRRADIFAAGVMLWESLASRRMWEGLGDQAIFRKLEAGEIPRLETESGAVAPRLAAICARATAADPSDRYPTARDFGDAIEELLEQQTSRAGGRQLASLLGTTFEAQRATTQAEIDEQLRGTASPRRSVDLPAAGYSRSYQPTPSAKMDAARDVTHLEGSPHGEARAARDGDAAAGPSTREPSRAGEPGATVTSPRTRRRAMTALAAVAVAASIGAILFVRARQKESPIEKAQPAECTTNAQCMTAHAGTPFVCRADRCVEVASSDCALHANPDDVRDESALWLGAMFGRQGSPGAPAFGAPAVQAIDLAVNDFRKIANGVLAKSGSGPSRPIVLVVCDDSVDARRASAHLVDDLRVPAVIGFSRSKELVDLANTTFVPNKVLAMSAYNMSPTIAKIRHPDGSPRLVFRTTPNDLDAVDAIAKLIPEYVEPAILKRLLPTVESLRVALVRNDTTNGLEYGDALYSRLRFNGKTALENRNNYRQLIIAEREGGPDFAAALAGLLSFKPHVIIYTGTPDPTRELFAPLEDAWPKSALRPVYVCANDPTALAPLLSKHPDLTKRALGLSVPIDTVENGKFVLHYNETYPDKVTLAVNPNTAYDATYALIYAAYAADAPTGEGMARATAKLSGPGQRLSVGPSSIFDAFAALASDKTITLVGTAGPLMFDATTGDVHLDDVVLCLNPDTSELGFEAVQSSLVYRAMEHRLEGRLSCW